MSKSCPRCNAARTLILSKKLVAKPTGTYSLAGVQTKVTATETLVLSCLECDWFVTGHIEGTDFVADPS